MPGQAVVTIKGKQWSASVANTLPELTSGLSGVKSLLPQTGMLFDLGYDQKYIAINMSQMLFPLDIIFINSTQGVVGALHNVQPGLNATFHNEQLPGARCFLEVNAGEAQGIEVGDEVAVQGYIAPASADIITPLMNLMMLMMFMTMMMKVMDRALAPSKARLKLPPGYEEVKWPQTKGNYDKELEQLRRDFREGAISEENYMRAVKEALARKHKPYRSDVSVHSWVERDRLGIWVTDKRTDRNLIEWWDEDAAQMFEDGWFKPGTIKGQEITGRDFEESVLDYLEYIGILEKSKQSFLPQTIEGGEVIEIPFKEAPEWLQSVWKRLHGGTVPRVRVYRTTVARIHMPFFEYAVRDIVAYKAGKTMSRYVPSYESLLSSSAEEKALYFGGAVTLRPDEMIAVMDYWGDRYKHIDLYTHPAAYEPPKLVAPTLTDRQMKILASIRGYTSAYRKEIFRTHKVTQSELDELQRMGLIDRRGAITVLGRNVAGKTEPLKPSYLLSTTTQTIYENEEGTRVLPFAQALNDRLLWQGVFRDKTLSVLVTGVSGYPQRLLEDAFKRSTAILSYIIKDRELPLAAVEKDKVWWLATIEGRSVEVQVSDIVGLTQRQLEDALANSVATITETTVQRVPTGLQEKVRELWGKACAWEGIPPDSKFVVFSEDNPFVKDYNAAFGQLLRFKQFQTGEFMPATTFKKGVKYVKIIAPGRTYLTIGSIVTREELVRENKKARERGEQPATAEVWEGGKPVMIRPKVIPTEKTKAQADKLEYLADSPEFLTQTIDATGYRDKLDNAFQQAIARAKGLK